MWQGQQKARHFSKNSAPPTGRCCSPRFHPLPLLLRLKLQTPQFKTTQEMVLAKGELLFFTPLWLLATLAIDVGRYFYVTFSYLLHIPSADVINLSNE
jgi:hypothetical protein